MDPDTLSPAMDGIDWVFHAAGRPIHWINDPLLVPTIVEGTKNVLIAAYAANARRLIYTSSVAALGIPGKGEMLTEKDQNKRTSKQ
jgi:dihydroflavonol-4-reductase